MVAIQQTVKTTGIPHRFLETTVVHVLRNLKKTGDVNLWLIGDRRMRRLNRENRGKDSSTDVLSFPLASANFVGGTEEWGDIFLCVPQIERQAKELSISYKEECTRMLIHGVLHLLGYDHVFQKEAKVMFALQEKFLKQLL